jgi:Ser/Thr protein kinase RdoA (MazF antagonist)
VSTDLARVDVVSEGYRRWHTLTPAELERLPDAVRVRLAVIAARSLARSIEQAQPTGQPGWCAR